MRGTPKYRQAAQPIETRVADLLRRMTLEEKLAQLSAVFKEAVFDRDEDGVPVFSAARARKDYPHGLGRISILTRDLSARHAPACHNQMQRHFVTGTRLGIPVLTDNEGLHGCMAPGCTSFPQAVGLAATWNPALVQRIAAVIGREARARGDLQLFSPVCDIARDSRCGRTEETYGEDPWLASRMAAAYVRGVQSQRVVTTPKHFAANFVGDGGRDSFPIHMSERLLREVYLPPYEAAIREAGALSVMSAYHSLDGVPCTANRWLLTDLLRTEWGFQGIVVSDWHATSHIHEYHKVAEDYAEAGARALTAGLDVELPYSYCFQHLARLVRRGRVPPEAVEEAARRVLRVKFWTGIFDRPYLPEGRAAEITGCPAHRALALEAARQCLVLLKNDGLLPLSRRLRTLAVIGPNADAARLGGYSATDVDAVTPLAGIRRAAPPAMRVVHEAGCDLTGPSRRGFARAVRAARRADAVVLVMGNSAPATEGEGQDRSCLDLPGVQEELIAEVARANDRAAVVLVGGSAVTLDAWAGKVRGILAAWYPGQEGGTALAEVLFGAAAPGGKLPLTFPTRTGQAPLYYNPKPSGREYDYNDLRGKQSAYPFGHGLSYTTFEYANLRVRRTGAGTNLRYAIRANIRNAGPRAADEVVQLYVRDEYSRLSRPLKELKGFRRIALKPGQRRTVRFDLSWQDLAYLGEDLRPTLEPGALIFMLGSSSDDIRLRHETEPRKAREIEFASYEHSALLPPTGDILHAAPPARGMTFSEARVAQSGPMYFANVYDVHKGRHGLIYLRTRADFPTSGPGRLFYGADGPVRVWLNGEPVGCAPHASNPAVRGSFQSSVVWRKGRNELAFALSTNHGKAWGVTAYALPAPVRSRKAAG